MPKALTQINSGDEGLRTLFDQSRNVHPVAGGNILSEEDVELLKKPKQLRKEIAMDASLFLPLLTFLTLGGVIAFALIGRDAIEKRQDNEDAPKSTLAADKDSHGKPADV